MYKIAICDDEIGTCNQLEEYIERFMKSHYISGEIVIFYTGENLCEYMRKHNTVNLVFLDIELPKINGVQVGKYIRYDLKDEVTDIIYISSKTNYALDLFKCRPFDFMIKPLQYDKIEKIMDIVISINEIKSQNFAYKKGGIIQRIPLQQIIYFKSNDKKIHIVLCSGEERIFNGKLSDVKGKVTSTLFIQIHKSYLVNYEYVLEYTYEWVKMINNDVLNISQAYRKHVKVSLMQHEIQKGDLWK